MLGKARLHKESCGIRAHETSIRYTYFVFLKTPYSLLPRVPRNRVSIHRRDKRFSPQHSEQLWGSYSMVQRLFSLRLKEVRTSS